MAAVAELLPAADQELLDSIAASVGKSTRAKKRSA